MKLVYTALQARHKKEKITLAFTVGSSLSFQGHLMREMQYSVQFDCWTRLLQLYKAASQYGSPLKVLPLNIPQI